MRTKSAQVADLATRQHGVISLPQLLAAGLSRDQVKRWVRAGRLHRLYRGVYAVGHTRLGPHGPWFAAVLACGPGAVLSHRSAAALWGIRRSASPRVEVIVPTRNGRRRRGKLAVHRMPLHPSEVTVCEGIPVTPPARTLLDLAAVVPRQA